MTVAAVDALTKRPGESYDASMLRTASNDIGRNVKLADLRDNSDLSGVPEPTEADFERLERYRRAIGMIPEV